MHLLVAIVLSHLFFLPSYKEGSASQVHSGQIRETLPNRFSIEITSMGGVEDPAQLLGPSVADITDVLSPVLSSLESSPVHAIETIRSELEAAFGAVSSLEEDPRYRVVWCPELERFVVECYYSEAIVVASEGWKLAVVVEESTMLWMLGR